MVAAAMAFAGVEETESEGIARALRRKDSEFIGRLVARYHYRLLRYLVYVTGRRERAEDLVQETWLRVLERSGQFDGRLRFEPWLFSIARHLAIDDSRRRQAVPESAADGEMAASDSVSPFVAAARNEDALRVAGALGELEPIYREALLLRFQEELSLEEIGRVVGAGVSTVSSRIQRGLGILRSSMKGENDAR